jgi:hypothetical protein
MCLVMILHSGLPFSPTRSGAMRPRANGFAP